MQGSDGALYGTAAGGGADGNGTCFRITLSGALSVLHDFSAFTNGPDGAFPHTGLVQGSDGSFYGCCAAYGANGTGLLYKLTASGAFTPLYSFSAAPISYNADGASPFRAGLMQASDGDLYGMANQGGPTGFGTTFKITPAGAFTTLYPFAIGSMVQASDGDFYGTGWLGANGSGSILKITSSGALSTLHSFGALNYSGTNADGSNPSVLIQASNGNLYGDCAYGGANGNGTIYQLTPSGTFTLLHSFTGADGANPGGITGIAGNGSLIQASDGNLYGACVWGGANGHGTIFRITPTGTFTLLHTFSAVNTDPSTGSQMNTDGAYPTHLIQGSDGYLYGTTWQGEGARGGELKIAPLP